MSVTAERLMVEVQADVRDALRKLDQVERRGATMASRASRWGKSFALMFGGAAVAKGFQETIGRAMTFDKVIRQVGVQTDQTGKKLESLSDLALKMGKDTVYSAQDAGGAMLELAKGGLSAAQIRAGALEQTLRLAAAGGLELSNSAGYIVQGLTTYGLKARQAAQVTTALAGGANASTASVESLGLALSQVGPGAVNAGMSIQETVAALAAFDNAGIKGSDAGTSLKTMLASLVPNTIKAKDAMQAYGLEFVKRNGDFKSMTQVAQELKDGLGDLSQAERTAALRTIFGSDATRAATVLMRNGAKGMRDYIKATRDRAKTEEMANAAMEGASGAWENFKGSVETAAILLGQKMLPAFTKVANAGGDFVDDVTTWGPQVEDTFGWIGDAAKGAWTAIKPGIELAGNLVEIWSDLPGPIKETTVQVGLAAVLFPRLAAAASAASASVVGGFTAMSAKARQYAAEMTYATTRTALLGSAARTAAGVGGMVLLAKSTDETSTSMSALKGAAAGALLGFSVGGPWGGAIGAGAGALWGLKNATDSSAMSMEEAKGDAIDYASSLNQITGAATKATRSTIANGLAQRGVLQNAARLGVSTRDLVSAIMGQEDAQARVNGTLQDASRWLRQMGREGKLTDGMYRKWAPAIGQVKEFLAAETNEMRRSVRETREKGQAILTWREALKGIPKKAVTKLEAQGFKATYDSVKKLKEQYDLTPEQVRTVVKALNVDVTKRQMKDLTGQATKLGTIQPWVRTHADTGQAERDLERTKGKVLDLGRQKANPVARLMDYATGGIQAVNGRLLALDGKEARVYVTTVQRTIRQAGRTVGGALPEFANGGYTGGQSPREVTGVVHGREYVMDAETTKRALPLLQAIHARKGRVFGYAEGGRAGDPPGARKWAGDFVSSMVRDVRAMDTLRDLTQMFNRWERAIRRNTNGERQAALLKKANAVQERLTAAFTRGERIQKRLADAQEKLASRREARSSFVGNVTQGMAQQATVLNAGNTASAIRQSLAVQVNKVKRFARMLRQLRKMGYARGIILQVAQAGVEGGYAAAEALVNASAEDRRAISESYQEIQKVAKLQAKALGSQMYDASVQAAQGLVDGLKKRKRQVRETLLDIAMAYSDALKAALDLGGKKGGGSAGGNSRTFTGAQPTAAALIGGTKAGSVSFTFITHNPQAEPQSRTTNNALAKVGALGLVG